MLRAHTYLSVPELVGEAERLLGLDIEVAARAGTSPGRARAQLDAFRDVAVEFARSADHPNLGGFLAWLEAADARENGLDMPVSEPDPDAVQLITVHAAKGLEWDVVAVAGLVDGGLPATATQGKDGPKDSAWLTGLGSLPYPLRGDRHDLPVSRTPAPTTPRSSRSGASSSCSTPATTRSPRSAGSPTSRSPAPGPTCCSPRPWWGDGTRVRKVSLFLDRARRGRAGRDGRLGAGARGRRDEPARLAGAHGHLARGPVRRRRRADPTRARRGGGRAGCAPRMAAALADGGAAAGDDAAGARRRRRTPHPWDVLADRLLAERERARDARRARSSCPRTCRPRPWSGSTATRRSSRSTCAARCRPSRRRRPAGAPGSTPGSRAGTAAASLVDVDALPGADDDSAVLDLDERALREAFLATEWADRSPVAVEVDIEISVDGYVLRSRIDAVFPDPAAATGSRASSSSTGRRARRRRTRPPGPSRELQLAVYRLAWSRWTGTPLERVRAAFCYVGAGVTVYPERLLDEAEIADLLSAATRGPQAPGAVAAAGQPAAAPGPTHPAAAVRDGRASSAAPARRAPQPSAPTLFDGD